MNNLRRTLRIGALLSLAACTPGGVIATSSGGGGSSSVTIDVNLTLNPPPISIPAGTGGGYRPDVVNVMVGQSIVFTNTDSFAHTATSIKGSTFPSSSPFSVSAQHSSGSSVSTGWSSGTLNPGASSQPILVDAAGTYFFGCFYHYGAPMRGEIIAH
jgi:plastocyanin